MNRVTTLAVVAFIAVFVAVFGVVGLTGVFGDETDAADVPSDVSDIDNPQYDAAQVSEDRTPGTADIQMDTEATDSTVVIHAGVGVTGHDLTPLVNALTADGHEVSVLGGGAAAAPPAGPPGPGQPAPGAGGAGNIAGELGDADGYISLGVVDYSDAELDALEDFLADDGRMLLGLDPIQAFTEDPGSAETFSELGVFTEPGYVYNLEENDLNYQRIFAEPAGDSELTEGVDRVLLDTATAVGTATPDERLEPTVGSELSTTREPADSPVLVRDDNVALIGDTEFLTPENVQRVDNDAFLGNIAEWLVEGDRAGDGVDAPSEEDGETEEGDETVTVAVGPDGQNQFDPQITEIAPGTTVEFVWESDGHNIVPVAGEPRELVDEFGVEEPQEEGFTYEFTFEEEGGIEFVSEASGEEMFGVVVVGEPGG